MFFKLQHSLGNQFASNSVDLPVCIEMGENQRKFEFWNFEGTLPHQPKSQLCCDYVSSLEPPDRVVATLTALTEGLLLLDEPVQSGIPFHAGQTEIVNSEGQIKPGFGFPFELLPRGSKPWLKCLHQQMTDQLVQFLKCVRWHQSNSGGYQVSREISFRYSFDGLEWHGIPRNSDLRVVEWEGLLLKKDSLDFAVNLFENSYREPVSHELAREASELVQVAPRSALLVAVTALETGVADLLSSLLPKASPLLKEIQSPPLIKLLNEVIPQILKESGTPSEFFPINNEATKYLKKWISQRNELAHGRREQVDATKVSEFVEFVISALYILDCTRGHSWALKYVTHDCFLNDSRYEKHPDA
ncbi:hypothetical protein [uncultured Shimia sp.]|uniref:hypothetical protein n=1 Tax=uncultured Shimia sp. TaxID=573152 RepID=UPI00261ABF1B|nr:hypothetical protein [uncultured Shimia sp.]